MTSNTTLQRTVNKLRFLSSAELDALARRECDRDVWKRP